MSRSSRYTIRSFIDEAKSIFSSDAELRDRQMAIGALLSELSQRDDLTRFGLPLGPTDASTGCYLLWREPPATALFLGEFSPGYVSAVHEHGEHWVVGCGYRGEDRWDIYERVDEGQAEGYADVRLVDQCALPPGRVVIMPAPPRAIHSHNNNTAEIVQELIFSIVPPLAREQRLVYNVEEGRSWPSPFDLGRLIVDRHYPPVSGPG